MCAMAQLEFERAKVAAGLLVKAVRWDAQLHAVLQQRLMVCKARGAFHWRQGAWSTLSGDD